MSEQNGQQPQQELIEGPGRYKVFQAPDGSWVVARATGICETCENCGCGEQAEPIVVPGMIVQLANSRLAKNGGLMGMLKAVAGRS